MNQLAIVAQDWAAQGAVNPPWLIYVAFLIAGLLVGGTWSLYQADKKALSIATAILAAAFLALAIVLLMGVMT